MSALLVRIKLKNQTISQKVHNFVGNKKHSIALMRLKGALWLQLV
jgi:hypothetical protein